MIRSRNLREKPKKRLLRKRVLKKTQLRGEIHTEKRKIRNSCIKSGIKTLISTGVSYFKI